MTTPRSSAVHRSNGFPRVALRRLGSPLRWVLAAAAVVVAAAHVPVIAPHLDEAPYMGGLFVVLTTGCLVLAGLALVRDSVAVYGLAVLTCGLAVVGYAATRLVAFPMLADDVGNWLEPLGVLSVVGELVVIITGVSALRRPAGNRPPGRPIRETARSEEGMQDSEPGGGALDRVPSPVVRGPAGIHRPAATGNGHGLLGRTT